MLVDYQECSLSSEFFFVDLIGTSCCNDICTSLCITPSATLKKQVCFLPQCNSTREMNPVFYQRGARALTRTVRPLVRSFVVVRFGVGYSVFAGKQISNDAHRRQLGTDASGLLSQKVVQTFFFRERFCCRNSHK